MKNQSQSQEQEQQANKIKSLIALGKEEGHLTYAQVRDYLPDNIGDSEQVENIIKMITDMGIAVYDKASDVEAALLARGGVDATTETD